MKADLASLAEEIVERALRHGATEADVLIETGAEFNVKVRAGEVESIRQASPGGLGLRVFADNRLGFSTSAELDRNRIDPLVARTVALARETAADPANALSEETGPGEPFEPLELFDPEVTGRTIDEKIRQALEMEKVALDFDPRIVQVSNTGVGDYSGEVYFASSRGVTGHYRGSHAWLYCMPIAQDGGGMETGWWVDHRRFLDALEAPESVGREAARRAVRMLGARKISSCEVPVIMEPEMAKEFIAGILGAVDGDTVYKQASFLAGRIGEVVTSPLMTLVDDATLDRAVGSRPFDGDGLPTRRNRIVDRGVLKTYLYDVCTARRAGVRSTASASRGRGGLPSIGPSNFFLEPGGSSRESILGETSRGILITKMMGRGLNTANGDYSRGAAGLWIEDGVPVYPVDEITVAGNMLTMLERVDRVGNDLDMRGALGAPTLRFSALAVGGK